MSLSFNINWEAKICFIYNDHGEQQKSSEDGDLSYPDGSWASLPEAGKQYFKFEPSHGKTNNLHRRKERCRSAS